MANWAQKLKLHHLQTLIALGEQGNLTHVARMMNITQPALSKWLSQLEDEMGITLFERHSKGLRPSEGGRLLLQHAQRLINDMERSQYEIAVLSREAGRESEDWLLAGGDGLRFTGDTGFAHRAADLAS